MILTVNVENVISGTCDEAFGAIADRDLKKENRTGEY
jgi:hypothetical protein